MASIQKPKHPLSAYNLFFQLERKRILEGIDTNEITYYTQEDAQLISAEHKLKGKRVHRKTHGKIGFRELARTVAARWKKIDPETKKILEEQAVIEKQEHARLHKAWKAQEDAKEEQLQEETAQTEEPASQEGADKEQIQHIIDSAVQAIQGTPRLQTLGTLLGQIEAEMVRLGGAENATRLLAQQHAAQQAVEAAVQQQQAPFPEISIPLHRPRSSYQSATAALSAAAHTETSVSAFPHSLESQDAATAPSATNALMQQAATLSAAVAVLQHDAELRAAVAPAQSSRSNSFSGLHQLHAQWPRNNSFSGLQQLQIPGLTQAAAAAAATTPSRTNSISGLAKLAQEIQAAHAPSRTNSIPGLAQLAQELQAAKAPPARTNSIPGLAQLAQELQAAQATAVAPAQAAVPMPRNGSFSALQVGGLDLESFFAEA